MGTSLAIGAGLIAFGPSVMLWTFLVARGPALVIIAIVSAFFWLMSIALASLLWTMIPVAEDIWLLTVTTGVVLQGFGRLALARAYLRVEHVLNSIHARATREEAESEGSFLGDGVNGSGRTRVESEGGRKLFLKLNGVSSSLAAGTGWGAMHAVVMVGGPLAKHTGMGAMFSPQCPWMPSVITLALSAQAFVWLDLLLLSAVFSAERRRDARLTWLPFVLHYLAGLTTGLNHAGGGCAASIPLLYVVVIGAHIVLHRFCLFRWFMASDAR